MCKKMRRVFFLTKAVMLICLIYRLSERKEELGDITNYVTDVSPMGYFKRVHPDEKMMDASPAKVIYVNNNKSCFSISTNYYPPTLNTEKEI